LHWLVVNVYCILIFYFYVWHIYKMDNKMYLVTILFVRIVEFFLFKLENKCQYNVILVYLYLTKIMHNKDHLFFITFCTSSGETAVYVFQWYFYYFYCNIFLGGKREKRFTQMLQWLEKTALFWRMRCKLLIIICLIYYLNYILRINDSETKWSPNPGSVEFLTFKILYYGYSLT
jgi:hypothetical protein